MKKVVLNSRFTEAGKCFLGKKLLNFVCKLLTLNSNNTRNPSMIFKGDIQSRIQTDFGENSDKAKNLLLDAISTVDYLNSDRIIRCIVFLAKGNLNDLNKYIECATLDVRDVMLWAEYQEIGTAPYYKRLRDFNYTFETCTHNVSE